MQPESMPTQDMVGDSLEAEAEFAVGDLVLKDQGYRFPGEVVAVFRKTNGTIRYVVESTSTDTAGMLHIFNGHQLVEAG